MAGKVVDFVARGAALTPDKAPTPPGPADAVPGAEAHMAGKAAFLLQELQSALWALRAELVQKQGELRVEGMDLSNALFIGAQASAILEKLAKLEASIETLQDEE